MGRVVGEGGGSWGVNGGGFTQNGGVFSRRGKGARESYGGNENGELTPLP